MQTGILKHSDTVPNTIELLFFSLNVATARWLSLIGLVLSVGGLFALGMIISGAARGDEASRIRLKYDPLLINVNDTNPKPDTRVIKVASIDDLAKLAERDGHMILHEVRGTTHHYLVQDGTVTYSYQAANSNNTLPALAKAGSP
jgi:hypothetical protein